MPRPEKAAIGSMPKTLAIIKGAVTRMKKDPRTLVGSGAIQPPEFMTFFLQDAVEKGMAERGYKFTGPAEIRTRFEETKNRMDIILKDEHDRFEDRFNEALANIDERMKAFDVSPLDRTDKADDSDEWSDVSNNSVMSNASSRARSLVRVKSKMQQSMRDSSTKRTTRLAVAPTGLTPGSKKQKMTHEPAERQARSRAPKSNLENKYSQRPSSQQRTVARNPSIDRNDGPAERQARSRAPKENKNESRTPSKQRPLVRNASIDRAEFARVQNLKVQQVKEKQLKAPPKKAATKSTLLAPTLPAKAPQSKQLPQGGMPPPASLFPGQQGDFGYHNDPFNSSTSVDVHPINSTFISGVNHVPPMFNASMALDGPSMSIGPFGPAGAHFPVPNDATFAMPVKVKPFVKNPVTEDTLMNVDESYRNYGLEDLHSDSDNTDDETQPSKPVPAWAQMRTERFKKRLRTQNEIGTDITKYGLLEIVVPNIVDLDKIFEQKLDLERNLDTSSFNWDTTQTFIQH